MANKLAPVQENEMIVRVNRGSRGAMAYFRIRNERVAALLVKHWADVINNYSVSAEYRTVGFNLDASMVSMEQLDRGFTCKIMLPSSGTLPSSELMQQILSAISTRVLQTIRNQMPVVLEHRFTIQ